MRRYLFNHPGMTLVEVMIVLLLGSILAALSITLITRQPRSTWIRLTHDYVHELSALYESVIYSHGAGPLQATDPCEKAPCKDKPLYPGGIADILIQYESTIRYHRDEDGILHYPGGMTVYLYPDHYALPGIPKDTGRLDDLMNGTHDLEWLFIDINGDTEPNTLGPEGDQVLIHLDDQTGHIQTAYQKCREQHCHQDYGPSYYDIQDDTQ